MRGTIAVSGHSERLAARARRGDRIARATLVEEHMGLVRSVAFRYRDLGLPFDDLVQEGAIGLLAAIDDYDPSRGEFAAVPAMVAEGRKILRNVQRVAKLFVTKSAFAAFLVLSIGLTPTAYPLLPRQLTLAASLTIGIPGFFLALAPSTGRYSSKGFLRELARFALPAGTAAGLGVLSSYVFALNVLDLKLVAARTVAVTVLVLVGLYLILALEVAGRVRGAAVSTLCLLLLIGYALVLLLPFARDFFSLASPSIAILAPALAGALLAIAGLGVLDDRFIPGRGAGTPAGGDT